MDNDIAGQPQALQKSGRPVSICLSNELCCLTALESYFFFYYFELGSKKKW